MAWQTIWRLAGADHMHVNGLANKFSETDDSVTASARACLAPMFADKPCTVLPVFSSGQTVRQAHPTWAALRSTDYKLCSTFDSAPHVGSVGRAAEVAAAIFPGWFPMVVADPAMGRF